MRLQASNRVTRLATSPRRVALGRFVSQAGLGLTLLLIGAIGLGSGLGLASPALGDALGGVVDWTVLALVTLLFFEARLAPVLRDRANIQVLALAWVANFLIIPALGFAIASLFLTGRPLFATGLVIYFMAPCTDWFLGFTRLARGNTSLGAALLPINMISQLLLYPVYLHLYTANSAGIDAVTVGSTLLQWFALPVTIAVALRLLIHFALPVVVADRLRMAAGTAIPLVLAVLVITIFAANVRTISENAGVFPMVVLAVFAFFVVTFVLSEGMARLFGLAYPERALLTMTTAARNAPLMLGITTVAIPDQPVVYAAIVIGMLVEFPHLTALRLILLRDPQARVGVFPESMQAGSHTEPGGHRT